MSYIIPDGSIKTAKIATGAVTQDRLAARSTGSTVGLGGVAISASCGAFSTASTTNVAVTNLSVTITTSGRPVAIQAMSDGATNQNSTFSPSGGALCEFHIYRASTQLANYSCLSDVPSSTLMVVDAVAAGTYTYTVQMRTSNGADAASLNHAVLTAYEL